MANAKYAPPIAGIAVGVAIVAAALLGILGDPRQAPGLTIALHLTAAVGLGMAVFGGRYWTFPLQSWRAVFLIAAALRLCFLIYPISDDVNRYILEGFMQAQERNPYAWSPAEFAAVGGTARTKYRTIMTSIRGQLSPQVMAADQVYRRTNQKDLSAAYPPVAMLMFRGLAQVGGYWPGRDPMPSYMAHKVAALLADLIALALLAGIIRRRRGSPGWLALYAWNPLVLSMGVGECHVDVYQTTMIIAAIWAFDAPRRRRWAIWLAWPLLGLAVGLKYFAIILAPLLLTRRNWKYAPLILLPALTVIPFRHADLFASLRQFGAEYHYLDLLPRLLRLVGLPGTLGALVLAAALLALAWRGRRELRPNPDRLQLGWWALLVCLPTVHPWYALPLMALLALRPRLDALALAATLGLGSYTYGTLHATGEWTEAPWLWLVVWLPPLLLLGLRALPRRRPQTDPA